MLYYRIFWQGKNWNVKVIYSKAGVATQILISTLECDISVDARIILITPRSCSEVGNLVEGFMAVYGDTMPFPVIMRELSNEEKMTIGRMEVQAFSVIHRRPTKVYGLGKRIPASGYSVSYNKQRIVISGDTGMCQVSKKVC